MPTNHLREAVLRIALLLPGCLSRRYSWIRDLHKTSLLAFLPLLSCLSHRYSRVRNFQASSLLTDFPLTGFILPRTLRVGELRQAILLTAALLAGCKALSRTEQGALVGAGMGGIAGTAIGAATGNPRTGAALGALGGALFGGAVGHDEDRREHEEALLQTQAERDAAQQQLGLMDVITLSQQGTDPIVIINQIRSTGSTFHLSTADLQFLTQNKVDSRVIQAMQETRLRPGPSRIIVREPPVIIERPYFYAPCPPPIGFGFHYVRVR